MYTPEEDSVLRRLHGMLSHQQIEAPKQFGDVIRALLQQAHVPLSKVAQILNCSELMIQLWERDQRLPSEDVWPDLIDSIVAFIDTELD